MRSSRWQAQGNVYLVTDDGPLTPDGVRSEVGDADGILEVFRHRRGLARDRDLEPGRLPRRDVGQRDADRGQLAGRTHGRGRGRRPRRSARGACPDACRATSSSRTSAPVAVGEPEEVEGIRLTTVDVGNPHAVVEGDPAQLPRIGPLLEVHERFPRRTNVQVARRTADGIEARVWERGAGETASSGSSAVAVAAAFGCEPVVVSFPGGELTVRFVGAEALLTGPATRVDT